MRQIMLMLLLSSVCGIQLNANAAALNQAPVEVVSFALSDGSKMDALDVTENEVEGVVSYSIVATDGRTRTFHDRDIVSRTPRQLDFEALPKETQEGLAIGRAARKRMILSAAQRVSNAENRLQKAYNAVGRMEEDNGATAASVKARLLEIDEKIAQADAQYDGAKAVMGGALVANAGAVNAARNVNAGNPGAGMLQRMEKSAVNKVQLQQEKKVLSEGLDRYTSTLAKLQSEVNAAQIEVDAAKSQLATAIAKRPVLYIVSPSDFSGAHPSVPQTPPLALPQRGNEKQLRVAQTLP